MGDYLHAGWHAAQAGASANPSSNWNGFVVYTALKVRSDAAGLVKARSSRYSPGQQNGFRHTYGACQLARTLGPAEARETTNAHETKLQTQNKAEQRDSDADMENNALGISRGVDPNHSGESCEKIADEAVQTGDAAIVEPEP